MKRSSMVNILKESFIRHMNPDGPANNDEEMYSLILEDLEKAGMLPPSTEFKIAGKKYTVNVWEKE